MYKLSTLGRASLLVVVWTGVLRVGGRCVAGLRLCRLRSIHTLG